MLDEIVHFVDKPVMIHLTNRCSFGGFLYKADPRFPDVYVSAYRNFWLNKQKNGNGTFYSKEDSNKKPVQFFRTKAISLLTDEINNKPTNYYYIISFFFFCNQMFVDMIIS